MPRFDDGIGGYVDAECVITIHFAADRKGRPLINCSQCELYLTNSKKCFVTQEIPHDPDHFVGHKCPLRITGVTGKVNEDELNQMLIPEEFVGQKCPLECKKEGDRNG